MVTILDLPLLLILFFIIPIKLFNSYHLVRLCSELPFHVHGIYIGFVTIKSATDLPTAGS